ncbi:hypothetical protein KY362_03420 [Candidatus Woesearchaeota archaeon]|nr:hypothetical protein [Candidatus Woesearchaeota archaeon]
MYIPLGKRRLLQRHRDEARRQDRVLLDLYAGLHEVCLALDSNADSTTRILQELGTPLSVLQDLNEINTGTGPAVYRSIRAVQCIDLLDAEREQMLDIQREYNVRFAALLGRRIKQQKGINEAYGSALENTLLFDVRPRIYRTHCALVYTFDSKRRFLRAEWEDFLTSESKVMPSGIPRGSVFKHSARRFMAKEGRLLEADVTIAYNESRVVDPDDVRELAFRVKRAEHDAMYPEAARMRMRTRDVQEYVHTPSPRCRGLRGMYAEAKTLH